MEKYHEIPMSEFSEIQAVVVNSVIHEGEMRKTEQVIALLERKVTEAYGENNRELIDFLENLIVEIENM